jgi:RHS repeat-associated protein
VITRRNFGKLGISAAAFAKVSPLLLFAGDAQGQAISGEGADIRRVGKRRNGTYWGHGSEQIDMLSGNLSYHLPLLHPHSRGCKSAVALSYNSQLWKATATAVQSYGFDSGNGYGWRLQIASILPEKSDTGTLGYKLIDGTGAEYKLYQNGRTWISRDSDYVTWDPGKSVLRFGDGSSMIFASLAGPHEADAGTLYPTLIQDTNGNQILVNYLPGKGQSGNNSSGRIMQIEDARAGYTSGNFSYVFLYNSDPIPRLLSIVDAVASSESYSLSYKRNTLYSPLEESVGQGELVYVLDTITNKNELSIEFQYNNYGELTQAKEPHNGIRSWNYRTFGFNDGRRIREVSARSLVDPYCPSNAHTHSFDRVGSDGGGAVHGSSIMTGPTGSAQKRWTFSSASGSPDLGCITKVEELSEGNVARSKSLVWSKTDSGRSYISEDTVSVDPGTVDEYSTTKRLARDKFGNLVSEQLFENGTSNSPASVTTHSYLADQAYLDRHIFNRRVRSTVQSGNETAELVSNKYDTTPLTDRTGLMQHASISFGADNTLRGNVTESYSSGIYNRIQYDITGTPALIQDSTQGQVALTPAEGSNNTLIGLFVPNGNENLGMQIKYEAGKAAVVTRPNGNVATHSYDSSGRKTMSMESCGRMISYAYSNGPSTVTTSSNGRWKKVTHGGFGQRVRSETGDASGTSACVLHTYEPVANAPLGKLGKTSLPHAANSEPQWVNYHYDDLGRKISEDMPRTGVPKILSYRGNSVTITDPAGRWKKALHNGRGQLVKLITPNADGNSQLETQYSYNTLGNLTSVTMPRGTATQKRSFQYDAGGRIVMAKHAESGPKTTSYNPDGTLASLTDAKGQKHIYRRDSYKRVSSLARFDAKNALEPNSSYSFYHDSNPFDPAFSQNTQGRLAAVQWGTSNSSPGLVTEMYSYNSTGDVVKKRLQVNRGGKIAHLDLLLSYDKECRLASLSYPSGGPALSYSYDSLGRLNGVVSETESESIVDNVKYDAVGHLTSMRILAREEKQYLVQNYLYDARNRLQRLIAAPSDSTANTATLPYVDLEYSYKPDDGKLLSETDHIAGNAVSYAYDNHGRIVNAESSDAAWGLDYTYDDFGNRTSQTPTKGQGPSHEVQHDPVTNWMLSDDTSYDANGNIVMLPYLRMSYDASNRLIQLDSLSGTENYGYDHQNLRIWKRTAARETFSFYHGTKRIADYSLETDALGNIAFRHRQSYIYFGHRKVQSGGEVVVIDRLGATRGWSNKHGAGRASYFPFGEKIQASKSDSSSSQDSDLCNFGGYLRNDGGLDYAQQRYYANQIGRFISPDPYGGSAHPKTPDSWNRYSFVNNDPINQVDPSGLDTARNSCIAAALQADTGAVSVTGPTATTYSGGHEDLRFTVNFSNSTQAANFYSLISRSGLVPSDYDLNGFGTGIRYEDLHAESVTSGYTGGNSVDTVVHVDDFDPNDGLLGLIGHGLVDVLLGSILSWLGYKVALDHEGCP